MSKVSRLMTPNAPRPTAMAARSGSDRSTVTQRAVGGDQLNRGDRGGQHAVAVTRAMGAGGRAAGHRDVRQRRHVGQREPLRLQLRGQHPVPGAGADRHRRPRRIDADLGRQRGQRHQHAGSRRSALNECRVPSARIRAPPATSSCSSATLRSGGVPRPRGRSDYRPSWSAVPPRDHYPRRPGSGRHRQHHHQDRQHAGGDVQRRRDERIGQHQGRRNAERPRHDPRRPGWACSRQTVIR